MNYTIYGGNYLFHEICSHDSDLALKALHNRETKSIGNEYRYCIPCLGAPNIHSFEKILRLIHTLCHSVIC